MSDFDERMILIYTFIGIAITIIHILIMFKDYIKSLFHSGAKQVLKNLALALIITPLAFFGYWCMYGLSYGIAKQIFGFDFIVMHLVANIPTMIILHFLYKGYKD